MEIKSFRLGENIFPDIFRGSQKRRNKDKSVIDQSIILDIYWKKTKYKFDFSKKFLNHTSRLIGKFQNIKKLFLFPKLIFLKKKILGLEKIYQIFQEKKTETTSLIGNLIHTSVSLGKNAKLVCLKIQKNFSRSKRYVIKYNHVELLKLIGAVDYDRGIKTSGNRGYFLKGIGLLLNNALIRYGLDFLVKRNFIALQTPFFMNKNLLSKCSQLEDFKEQLYGLNQGEDKFLIATSEQPISVFHLDETIENGKFPLKYVGFSSCFRKESGSHGKDTSGLFRVHQFEKVEQFILCSSDYLESWVFFNEMLENVKFFYSSINIPFKFLNIASNSLNNTASKKIDLLGFFPKSNTFRELVSCSNCTSYQSKKINIKVKPSQKNPGNNYPHMLNSTLCATTRVICCILENFQTESGIIIPSILRNYVGISFVPF
ncbi:sys1 (nucleomorph) [Hemiselmis andersenii]|uniref:serine--tRNA ligase n=1 Tax=Hemiselmis andersenii TaxID=464988 RepID=A9BL26_HEMAN|nr:sys1 [Hemiselmis andersenii]ABW98209.1 sys1 [Hemiselmis andersenii]